MDEFKCRNIKTRRGIYIKQQLPATWQRLQNVFAMRARKDVCRLAASTLARDPSADRPSSTMTQRQIELNITLVSTFYVEKSRIMLGF